MSEPYGTTAFCDDIRTESDGRTTLVGVYKNPLILPQIPYTIPKLGFAVSIVIPRSEIVNSVRLCIFTPDDAPNTPSYIADADMGQAMMAGISRELQVPIFDPDVVPPFHIWQNPVFSPVQIRTEGFFKVRFYYNDKVIKAGALRVEDGRRQVPLAAVQVSTTHSSGHQFPVSGR